MQLFSQFARATVLRARPKASTSFLRTVGASSLKQQRKCTKSVYTLAAMDLDESHQGNATITATATHSSVDMPTVSSLPSTRGKSFLRLRETLALYKHPLTVPKHQVSETVITPCWELFCNLSATERDALSDLEWDRLWNIVTLHPSFFSVFTRCLELFEARYPLPHIKGSSETQWAVGLFSIGVKTCGELLSELKMGNEERKIQSRIYWWFGKMESLSISQNDLTKSDELTIFHYTKLLSYVASKLSQRQVQQRAWDLFQQLSEGISGDVAETQEKIDTLSTIVSCLIANYLKTSEFASAHNALKLALTRKIPPLPYAMVMISRTWNENDLCDHVPSLIQVAIKNEMYQTGTFLKSRMALVQRKVGDLYSEVSRVLDDKSADVERDVYTVLLGKLASPSTELSSGDRWTMATKLYVKMTAQSIIPDSLVHEQLVRCFMVAHNVPLDDSDFKKFLRHMKHKKSIGNLPLDTLLQQIIPNFYYLGQPWNIPTLRWWTHRRLFILAMATQDFTSSQLLFSLLKSRELNQELGPPPHFHFKWTPALRPLFSWFMMKASSQSCSQKPDTERNFALANQLYNDALASGLFPQPATFGCFLMAIGYRGNVRQALRVISDYVEVERRYPDEAIILQGFQGFLMSLSKVAGPISIIHALEQTRFTPGFFTPSPSSGSGSKSESHPLRTTHDIIRLPTVVYSSFLIHLTTLSFSNQHQYRHSHLLLGLRLLRRIYHNCTLNAESVPVDVYNTVIALFVCPSNKNLDITRRDMRVAWLLYSIVSRHTAGTDVQRTLTFELLLQGLSRVSFSDVDESLERWRQARWLLKEGFRFISSASVRRSIDHMASEGHYELAKEVSEDWWAEVIRTDKVVSTEDEKLMIEAPASIARMEQEELAKRNSP